MTVIRSEFNFLRHIHTSLWLVKKALQTGYKMKLTRIKPSTTTERISSISRWTATNWHVISGLTVGVNTTRAWTRIDTPAIPAGQVTSTFPVWQTFRPKPTQIVKTSQKGLFNLPSADAQRITRVSSVAGTNRSSSDNLTLCVLTACTCRACCYLHSYTG